MKYSEIELIRSFILEGVIYILETFKKWFHNGVAQLCNRMDFVQLEPKLPYLYSELSRTKNDTKIFQVLHVQYSGQNVLIEKKCS